MKLTQEEEVFYDSTFQKINQGGLSCDEPNCLRILGRGIKDPETCNKVTFDFFLYFIHYSTKIWDLVSDNGAKKILEKDEFFVLLRYVAASQQGYKIEDLDIEELPGQIFIKISQLKFY